MADSKTIVRVIKAVFDRDSANRVQQQLTETLTQAGEKGGKNFLREIRAAFDRETAQLKEKLARGTIDEREFKKQSQAAARAFNSAMLTSMDAARAKSQITDAEYVKLTRTLKNVGVEGGNAFSRIRASMGGMFSGGLGQWVGAGTILFALRRANEEANKLDAAERTLASTAKITGTNFDFLSATAQQTNEKFGFGVVRANNFTIELAKLASKAGDLNAVAPGIQAFLDIGAARGLSPDATLVAVQQAILGIDEGTDKLFNKNPSVIYKEFAASIGTSVGKLTDQQKAQALLNAALTDGEKVRGEYAKWLTTAAGQQFLLAAETDKTYAALGKALQPALVAVLPMVTLLTRGVAGLIGILQDFGRIITSGVLVAVSGLAKANAFLARSYAGVISGAAATADFFGADGLAEKWRERADAIRAEAQATEALAAAAMDVARGTDDEIQIGRGKRSGTPGSAGGALTPPGTAPTAEQITAEAKARENAIDEEIRGLTQLQQLNLLRTQDIARALQLEQQLASVTATSAADRVTQGERLRSLGTITGPAKSTAALDAAFANAGGLPAPGVTPINTSILDPQAMADATRGHVEAANTVKSTWMEAYAAIREEQAASIAGTLGDVGKALADGGIKGLIQLAKNKVKENLARAIEMGALALGRLVMGDGAGAGAAAKSAAMHGAAALAWKGVASAGGGGGSASGGASAPSAGRANTARAADTEPKNETIINLVGDFDALNPRVQNVVHGAMQNATERIGPNASVKIHRRGAS